VLVAGCWAGVFIFERRLAAVQHTGSSRERLTARGQRLSPARARTPRGTAIVSAFCVRRAPDDGQAAHGWPGQQSSQFDRSLRRFRVHAESRAGCRWRAAGTLSTRGVPICVRTGTVWHSTARQLPGERCWVLLQFVHIYKATGQPRARARRHTAILRAVVSHETQILRHQRSHSIRLYRVDEKAGPRVLSAAPHLPAGPTA